MTRAPDLREIAATAARATLAVPGVAYLSPRLTDRLSRTPGIRVLPRDATRHTTIDISLAVHTGHQATAVAHQVRTAVTDALHVDHPRVWSTDVTVSVTVTAIV